MKAINEQFSILQENGWSSEQAEGHADGVTFRRRGMPPSRYALVGIDEYSLGFRAGYFERADREGQVESAVLEPAIRLARAG